MCNTGSYDVVHLLPHVGGGVGTVVKKLVENSIKQCGFSHRFIVLESLNDDVKSWCRLHRIEYLENAFSSGDRLYEHIDLADIVHIHWWNHPLLMEFLYRNHLPHARTILWSHVNGAYVPQVFSESLFSIPDRFVVATPFSLDLESVKRQAPEFKDNILKIIQSNAGPLDNIYRKNPVTPPRVGYIGTVDYSKMHSDFIDIWLEVNTDISPLLVCGGPSEEILREEVNRRGCAHRFDIRGHVENVPELLAELDVLFYPLNETHYGTGEQILVEAMSAGVVPVVLANSCEAFIVSNKETGFVAQNVNEFILYVDTLCADAELRREMGGIAKKVACSRFSIEQTVSQWHDLYCDVLNLPKRRWGGTLPALDGVPVGSVAHLFLSSYGDSCDAALFGDAFRETCSDLSRLPEACYSETRGSAHHYSNMLPDDGSLAIICKALRTTRKLTSITSKRCCPFCNKMNSELLLKLDYALFDDLEFEGVSNLVNCGYCGFTYNEFYFTENNLEQYYRQNDYYLDAVTGGSGGISSEDGRRYQLIWDTVQPFIKKQNPSVLDVGCGKGGFLNWLMKTGLTSLAGVEPGKACRDYLKANNSDVCVFSSVDELTLQTFDVIILSHVLEHVINPRELLSELRRVMNESTVVYIEVPDSEFYLKSSPLWKELYFEHINHFTKFTLHELCGIENIRCQLVKSKRFSSHIKDSPDCLYAVCFIESKASDFRSDIKQNKTLSGLDDYIEREIIRGTPNTFAFWGISQYVQLLLGSKTSLLNQTVGLFDSSPTKIGRSIRSKKIKHFDAISSLNSDVVLLLPDKEYAYEMEEYLASVDFKGEIRRF